MKDLLKKFIPAQYVSRFVHIRKSLIPFGFTTFSYSEHGEDILLNDFLFKKKNGFYVDIGAFHPKYISNTYLLHKKGWHGMNVDPNPEAVKLFKKYRPRDINLQLGIAETRTELTYYNMKFSGASTFSKEHAERKDAETQNEIVSTESVACIPLSELFNTYLPSDTDIDLLDIDVENMDIEVLRSNDWNTYRPRVVLAEDREFRERLHESPIYTYLYEQGYRFYSYTNITLIMCEKDFLKDLKIR